MASDPPTTNGETIPPERGSPAEELRYRLRQQRLSTEFALFALRTRDTDALLQEAARAGADGLLSRFCKVMEFLPDEDRFIVRAGVGWKPGVVGRARVGADAASPTGYAFRTGEAVISNHLQGETRFRTPDLLAEHGVKRAINTLIQVGGDRFGVLEVDSPVEGRFTESDLTFVAGIANLLGVALERQRTDAALRRNEQLLQQALTHQDVLVKEISHRIKNSLSIVASLLHLQARTSDDVDVRQALSDAQARVRIIAEVHDRLWRRDDIDYVNLAEFLGGLCVQLRASAPDHELVDEVAPVAIATDQAVSVGLLANELITNALKYAYPGAAGRVSLAVAQQDTDILRLMVADQGVGLPDPAAGASGGLGGRVIASLTRQLGAEVEWQDAGPGTRFVMTFRARLAPPRPQSSTSSIP